MVSEDWLYDDIGPYKEKDPQATLDYTQNLIDWLDGDTLTGTPVVTVTNGNKVSQSNTTTAITAWVSGGTIGGTIIVNYHFTTTGGRTDERTIRLKVVEQ